MPEQLQLGVTSFKNIRFRLIVTYRFRLFHRVQKCLTLKKNIVGCKRAYFSSEEGCMSHLGSFIEKLYV